MQEVLLFFFLLLDIVHVILDFILHAFLVHLDVLLQLLLQGPVLSLPKLFFLLFLALPIHLLYLMLHVSLSLLDDVPCFLLCLVYLLPCLKRNENVKNAHLKKRINGEYRIMIV